MRGLSGGFVAADRGDNPSAGSVEANQRVERRVPYLVQWTLRHY